MKTIKRESLKTKMDRHERFNLVMAMGRNAYDLVHIPGSRSFDSLAEAAEKLNPADEVVIYCSNEYCHANFTAYRMLRHHGFKKVYTYAGGLEDWQKAGYPLEGRMAAALKN